MDFNFSVKEAWKQTIHRGLTLRANALNGTNGYYRCARLHKSGYIMIEVLRGALAIRGTLRKYRSDRDKRSRVCVASSNMRAVRFTMLWNDLVGSGGWVLKPYYRTCQNGVYCSPIHPSKPLPSLRGTLDSYHAQRLRGIPKWRSAMRIGPNRCTA